jgi:uncharacterized protein
VRVRGDVHSHVWADDHIGEEFRADLRRVWRDDSIARAGYDDHARHAEAADRTVVLAFDAPHVGFVVPDEFVADYVARAPDRLIGFCSVDPVRRDPAVSLSRATEELGLRGVKLAPTYQGFDPLSDPAWRLYEEIARRDLPVVWHQGVTFVRRSIMAYALPRQIDEVALRYPELRIVIAHLGHPWIDECLGVIRKHPNVYADISALERRPNQLYGGLLAASEYGCGDKLLYGSDFPFGEIGATVSLLAGWAADPEVPAVVKATIAGLLDRDPLEALGL